MNNRGQMLFRIIAGIYLAYQGVNLLTKVIQNKPDNYMLYAVFAIVFIVVGVVFLIWAVKLFVKSEKEDIEIKSYQGEVTEDNESSEITEEVIAEIEAEEKEN